jgi:hypothetical protein
MYASVCERKRVHAYERITQIYVHMCVLPQVGLRPNTTHTTPAASYGNMVSGSLEKRRPQTAFLPSKVQYGITTVCQCLIVHSLTHTSTYTLFLTHTHRRTLLSVHAHALLFLLIVSNTHAHTHIFIHTLTHTQAWRWKGSASSTTMRLMHRRPTRLYSLLEPTTSDWRVQQSGMCCCVFVCVCVYIYVCVCLCKCEFMRTYVSVWCAMHGMRVYLYICVCIYIYA